MPKIIDHGEYRKELGTRAIALFRAEGYRTLSMRKLADYLHVPKSTLYHYFPSKQALFEYCGSLVTGSLFSQISREAAKEGGNLFKALSEQEEELTAEVALLFDFLRDGEGADKTSLADSLDGYRRFIADSTASEPGSPAADGTYLLLLGIILSRSLNPSGMEWERAGEILNLLRDCL